jgi:V-type H+-transporting ATPase subunit d
MAELAGFNVNHGFTEALVRGLRTGFLGTEDYRRLGTSDTLEDMRSALEETEYGNFLQDEPSPLMVSTISKRCYEKLAHEFKYVKAQTVEPLTTFMDFIAREKMIENVCIIVQGLLNKKAPAELAEKVHPLGEFESMKMIMSETDVGEKGGLDEVYRIYLVDTPIGPYFKEFMEEKNAEDDPQKGISAESILTKQDLEIMKASLKKAWLEDFNQFIEGLGGTTGEVMGDILKTEADFRVLLVTLNALNTHLSTQAEGSLAERNSLWPSFGFLYPEGQKALRSAWNQSTVSQALEPYGKYMQLFNQVKSYYEDESEQTQRGFQSLEDLIFSENVHMYEMAFEQQYHFGVFYAWVKLREQEIRNIRWIANMVILNTKDQINTTIVPIFQPRT